MNQSHQADGGDVLVADAHYQREDSERRDIVDRGIAVQQNRNTMSAVEYLKSRDIAPAVIERVLLEPHRRRALPLQASPCRTGIVI